MTNLRPRGGQAAPEETSGYDMDLDGFDLDDGRLVAPADNGVEEVETDDAFFADVPVEDEGGEDDDPDLDAVAEGPSEQGDGAVAFDVERVGAFAVDLTERIHSPTRLREASQKPDSIVAEFYEILSTAEAALDEDSGKALAAACAALLAFDAEARMTVLPDGSRLTGIGVGEEASFLRHTAANITAVRESLIDMRANVSDDRLLANAAAKALLMIGHLDDTTLIKQIAYGLGTEVAFSNGATFEGLATSLLRPTPANSANGQPERPPVAVNLLPDGAAPIPFAELVARFAMLTEVAKNRPDQLDQARKDDLRRIVNRMAAEVLWCLEARRQREEAGEPVDTDLIDNLMAHAPRLAEAIMDHIAKQDATTLAGLMEATRAFPR